MRKRPQSPPCPRSTSRHPVTFCIYCYLNRKCARNYVGHRYYRSIYRPAPHVEYIMKRETPVTKPKKGDVQCPDPAFGSPYPNVSAYLCDAWWDDGKPREPSSLTVKMDAEYVHVGLSDHAMSRSVYCTAPTLLDALRMLEELLEGGRVTWRPWKRGK